MKLSTLYFIYFAVTPRQKWIYLAFSYCHRNPVNIPMLHELLTQVKVHLTHNRRVHNSLGTPVQLPRVMYMLGENTEDIDKELKATIATKSDFYALQFGALYYEQTSRPTLALECCKDALDIMDHPFHSSVVLRCKQRLLSKH